MCVTRVFSRYDNHLCIKNAVPLRAGFSLASVEYITVEYQTCDELLSLNNLERLEMAIMTFLGIALRLCAE